MGHFTRGSVAFGITPGSGRHTGHHHPRAREAPDEEMNRRVHLLRGSMSSGSTPGGWHKSTTPEGPRDTQGAVNRRVHITRGSICTGHPRGARDHPRERSPV